MSPIELSSITPEDALKQLMTGNERYVQDKLLHPNRSPEYRKALSSRQAPFAIVLGCSDSRVSPEIVFDQGIGDLFVVRVAGNVIGPIELASIKFSAEYLGSAIVVVLGHENCGAVQAFLNHQTKDIEPIAQKIEAALKDSGQLANNSVENVVKINVRSVVAQLISDELLSKLISEKKIQVVGGYYHLSSGKVELLKK